MLVKYNYFSKNILPLLDLVGDLAVLLLLLPAVMFNLGVVLDLVMAVLEVEEAPAPAAAATVRLEEWSASPVTFSSRRSNSRAATAETASFT